MHVGLLNTEKDWLGRIGARYDLSSIGKSFMAHSCSIAGGGSYYFAKRSIKADRNARHEAEMKRWQVSESPQHINETQRRPKKNSTAETSHESEPAQKYSPENDEETKDRHNYVPFRSKKGDRFS